MKGKGILMKRLGLVILADFVIMLAGCGGGNNSGNINGNWTATLTDTSQNQIFAFTVNFSQVSGSDSLNISSLNFTTADSCFDTSNATASGTFTFTGNFNGNLTGTFGMAIVSGSGSDTLTLSNGAVANNQITGTWTLSGTGCSGSGTFVMNKS
jgi:hypothetical protein